ncbi:MAG: DeoR/GlpR transcriptional regulator [Chloroflexi bacterium]|nr:DeoR/GlpR transcriptional regulator [Chloroflexota bacterium]
MSLAMGVGTAAWGLPAHERREQIARLVEEAQRVSVADLTARFGVTDASIRRDLILLEAAARLRRVHGGAVSHGARLAAGAYSTKLRINREEKTRIGLAAARLVQPGEVVLFDSGTTVAQVAAQMPAVLRAPNAITAVTYSLPVIDEIGGWEAPHLVVVGGLYLPEYRAFVGPQAIDGLRDLTADVIFLGCDGLTVESGLTTPHVLVAEVGAAATSRSRRVVAVADSSKIGRQGFKPIVALSDVHVLITDTAADPGRVAEIRAAGVEVVLA